MVMVVDESGGRRFRAEREENAYRTGCRVV
jgi:hypothetical protein